MCDRDEVSGCVQHDAAPLQTGLVLDLEICRAQRDGAESLLIIDKLVEGRQCVGSPRVVRREDGQFERQSLVRCSLGGPNAQSVRAGLFALYAHACTVYFNLRKPRSELATG